MTGHIADSGVTEACLRLARVRPTAAALQDAVMGALLAAPGLHANAALVAYLTDRLAMMEHKRYRRDQPALRRLACEMVATLAELVRRDPQLEARPGCSAMARPAEVERLLERCGVAGACEVGKLLLHEGLSPACVEGLLRVKDFEAEVPVPHVARHLCRDPLWLAWLALTECYEFRSRSLDRYVRGLFTLYKFRFRRRERRERAALLVAAVRAATTGQTEWGALDTRLVGEAVLKFAFAAERV